MSITDSAFPVTKPVTEAGKTAARLHATVMGCRERLDKIERDASEVDRNLADARSELDEALFESERSGGKRTKRLRDAEAALKAAEEALAEPWRERRDAASRAIDAAVGELEQHVDRNLDELLSEPELRSAGFDVNKRVIRKAEELAEALDDWQRIHEVHVAMVAPAASIDGRAVRSLSKGGGELRSAVRGFLTEQDSNMAKLWPPLVKQRVLNERRAYLEGTLEGNELADFIPTRGDQEAMRDAEHALYMSGAYDG